jgi:hypothetical protein
MRNEIETKRNERNRNDIHRNETKRNLPKRNEIETIFTETKRKRYSPKRNEIYRNETKSKQQNRFGEYRFDFVSHFTGTLLKLGRKK